ncbi:hypothetical protein DESC_70080 [Desulfosarcina cetonica]|nr:hypothetical protein DESC_70080 [Desulfosarcina cetonica]
MARSKPEVLLTAIKTPDHNRIGRQLHAVSNAPASGVTIRILCSAMDLSFTTQTSPIVLSTKQAVYPMRLRRNAFIACYRSNRSQPSLFLMPRPA